MVETTGERNATYTSLELKIRKLWLKGKAFSYHMEVIYYSLIIRQTQQNGMLKCDGNKISWNFKIRKAFVMWNHTALNRHCGPHLGACDFLFGWFSKKEIKKKIHSTMPIYYALSHHFRKIVCVCACSAMSNSLWPHGV